MICTSRDAIRFTVDDQVIVNFASFDYLALSGHEAIINAGRDALIENAALGRIPAHFLGKQKYFADLEQAAKAYFSLDADFDAMYTNVGYMFGLISLQGISDEFDVAFIDEYAHYNLFDGINAVNKPYHIFKHMDAGDLRRSISENLGSDQIPVIITDGVFPTSLHVPPLDVYKRIADEHNGWLLTDESHAFGVLGNGRGAAHHFKSDYGRTIYGGSTSKGFASYGGIIIAPGSALCKMRGCTSAIGTNPGMSSGAAMTAASLNYLEEHDEYNERLKANIAALNASLREAGYAFDEIISAGTAFYCGDLNFKKHVQAEMIKKGYFVGCSVYQGSGPDGVLRITVTAGHTFDEIAGVVREFSKLVPAV